MTARRPNYWEYIRVEELLALQGGLEGEESELSNDEVLFITVHQVYELWFKLVLRELGGMRDLLADRVQEEQMAGAVRSARRVTVLLQRCVDHFEAIETLTTREYLSFRDKLMPASGFQSAQMRQIEILMGLDDSERIGLGVGGSYLEALRAHDGSSSSAERRVREQLDAGPSLREAFERWLYRAPIDGFGPEDDGAEAALDRFIASYRTAHAAEVDASLEHALTLARTQEDRSALEARYAAEKQALVDFFAADGDRRCTRMRAALLFLVTYQELPLLSWPNALLDAVIALEQQFVLFRQRHARMVERVIGRRTGTGGSSGVDYLDQTALTYRVFKDLWAVRTYQIRKQAAPALERPEFYGYQAV